MPLLLYHCVVQKSPLRGPQSLANQGFAGHSIPFEAGCRPLELPRRERLLFFCQQFFDMLNSAAGASAPAALFSERKYIIPIRKTALPDQSKSEMLVLDRSIPDSLPATTLQASIKAASASCWARRRRASARP